MIAIVDYGVGNLFSLSSSLKFLDIEARVTGRIEELAAADKIILPGVGAFADAIKKLKASGLDQAVIAEAKKGKPLLGICLGMQLLFEKSYEYGEHPGLSLIKGVIGSIEKDLPGGKNDFKIPHIGWNRLTVGRDDPIFKYGGGGDYFYYVHSYYAKDCAESVVAFSEYGVDIPGVVRRDNVYGMQFHPEKSGGAGLNLLKAFGGKK